MSLPDAYWDSSALIPLCVQQAQSQKARLLYDSYNVVTWWASEVEIISGLTRLKRMRQISDEGFFIGRQLAQEIIETWSATQSPPAVAANACSLLEQFPLSAADALQLAVALASCEHRPRGYVFITADLRLADAARDTGFSVELI